MKYHTESYTKNSKNDITKMIDKIFVEFDVLVFQHIVSIPMGTDFATRPAVLIWYSIFGRQEFLYGLSPFTIYKYSAVPFSVRLWLTPSQNISFVKLHIYGDILSSFAQSTSTGTSGWFRRLKMYPMLLGNDSWHNVHVAIVNLHFLNLQVFLLMTLFDWKHLITTTS